MEISSIWWWIREILLLYRAGLPDVDCSSDPLVMQLRNYACDRKQNHTVEHLLGKQLYSIYEAVVFDIWHIKVFVSNYDNVYPACAGAYVDSTFGPGNEMDEPIATKCWAS